MKYNKLSLISAGIILFDICFYIILLVLDSKNIKFQNFDGFVTIVFVLPFLAFVFGLVALIKIKKTKEKGLSVAQLAMVPFVIITLLICVTFLTGVGTEGGKHPRNINATPISR